MVNQDEPDRVTRESTLRASIAPIGRFGAGISNDSFRLLLHGHRYVVTCPAPGGYRRKKEAEHLQR